MQQHRASKSLFHHLIDTWYSIEFVIWINIIILFQHKSALNLRFNYINFRVLINLLFLIVILFVILLLCYILYYVIFFVYLLFYLIYYFIQLYFCTIFNFIRKGSNKIILLGIFQFLLVMHWNYYQRSDFFLIILF